MNLSDWIITWLGNLNLKLIILLLVDLRANKAVKLDFSSVQQEFFSGKNQAIKLINQIKQTNWLIRDQWNNLSVDSALNKWENRNRINQSLCHLNNYFIHLLLISEKELREIQALFLNSITCFKEICKNELVILKSILFFICFILVCCYDANNNLNLAIKLWYSKSMLMIHLILMRMRIQILDPHWKIWIRI